MPWPLTSAAHTSLWAARTFGEWNYMDSAHSPPTAPLQTAPVGKSPLRNRKKGKAVSDESLSQARFGYPAPAHASICLFVHQAPTFSHSRTYVVKQWDELCTLKDHKKAVTGLHWGKDATTLLSCGNDNMLRVFG